MFSILIPTYDYNVVSLVTDLYNQIINEKIPFEIICFDNDSKSKRNLKNETINTLEFCTFKSLKHNGGRSKIRNLLAESAKFNWLLFLDADVLPVSEFFIKNYLIVLDNKKKSVFYGGLKYTDIRPPANEMLRWVYGKKREEISLEKRMLNPGIHFTSANFLIEKKLFLSHRFDESLVEYGYEDTLLAINLKMNKITIHQIDNPVYHLGLNTSKQFIEKTKDSIDNLLYLQSQKKIKSEDNKLLKKVDFLKKIKLIFPISLFFRIFSNKMEQNLCSKVPSIFIYDLYKLGYICSHLDT